MTAEKEKNIYHLTPITRRVLADLETPLSIYIKLAKEKNSFLLESIEGGEKWGRYSIIGLPASKSIVVTGREVSVFENENLIERVVSKDPLNFIQEYQERFVIEGASQLPRFSGGLVGYFGFDVVRYVEPRLENNHPADSLGNPDIYLLLVDSFIIFDALKGILILVKYVEKDDATQISAGQQFLEELEKKLCSIPASKQKSKSEKLYDHDFLTEFNREKFLSAIKKIKEYILEGDVMQVVLAQRLSTDLKCETIDIYRALRYLNPSPYLYYFNFGDFEVIGSSPEILVRSEDGVVTTRPLAGTRARGEKEKEDLALERELLSDPKELAEHLMLIDLGRNDLGKICEIGTVEVVKKMVIERYSHVMHISSTVEGQLKKTCGPFDVLRATLPVGTLSGAPKIRAIEIIDELEPTKRGIYGGAVGYVSWNGDMDTAIAIRTAIVKDGRLYIQAGCGIVADSIPEKEWEETLNKGKAIFKAVEMAGKQLALQTPETF